MSHSPTLIPACRSTSTPGHVGQSSLSAEPLRHRQPETWRLYDTGAAEAPRMLRNMHRGGVCLKTRGLGDAPDREMFCQESVLRVEGKCDFATWCTGLKTRIGNKISCNGYQHACGEADGYRILECCNAKAPTQALPSGGSFAHMLVANCCVSEVGENQQVGTESLKLNADVNLCRRRRRGWSTAKPSQQRVGVQGADCLVCTMSS
ncbi:hypothetical protein BKA63DRAFT_549251 [Paraphoma chrysanthemicola]|nr:hypothetical protein BKA63DRAFT_549251 [Paraphoma chrysanthemicola]